TQALPQDWWLAWSLAPGVVAPLILLLWAGCRHAGGFSVRSNACFLGGWTLLAVALVSPLCRLAATLVSAHMVQLMVLAVAAPALMALGSTLQRLGLKPQRDRVGRAAVLYGAVLWIWHLPLLYDATLTRTDAHLVAYAVLTVASSWFWDSVLHAPVRDRGQALTALAATLAHTGFLGAILTFSTTVFYPVQSAGAAAWQLSALQDQQLAGLVMWVPGGLAYLAAVIALSLRWWAMPTAAPARVKG
ncbi:MAG: cytochrome c oxidase assembly protein, partial [Haliea sp.]